jgi:hypothetical protein
LKPTPQLAMSANVAHSSICSPPQYENFDAYSTQNLQAV